MKSQIVKKITSTESSRLMQVLTAKGKIYTFLNPVSYLSALENPKLFSSFDGIFADGSILVKAIKLVYGKKVIRRSFDMTSLAPKLMSHAQESGKSIYIVASKQEEVEKAVGIFKREYPNLIVAGCRNGYFNSDDDILTESDRIIEIDPDFLIVGMGIIAQEKFLLRVKERGYKGIGFTCGGFVHQTSKDVIDYYPRWADKWNLRFVYRLYKEKHTRMRYLQAAFVFPVRFVCEYCFDKN